MRAKGIVVSIVDILLCAVAMKREWAVFTTDPDFLSYAKVLPLTLHTPRLTGRSAIGKSQVPGSAQPRLLGKSSFSPTMC